MGRIDNLRDFLSSELDADCFNVSSIEIDSTPLGDGAFGAVYACVGINGAPPTHEQVIKILKEDAFGRARKGFDTIQKLQMKILARAKSFPKGYIPLAEVPALHALPQFSFTAMHGGQHVYGYGCLRLDTLGYIEFDRILDPQAYALRRRFQSLGLQGKLLLGYQLVEGFQILQDLSYIHADLNPKNIFVNIDQCCLAIIDFDSGAVTEHPGDKPTTWGKPCDGEWQAFEILREQERQTGSAVITIKIDFFTDLWSVAVGIHNLLFLCGPLFYLTEISHNSLTDYFSVSKLQWPEIAPHCRYIPPSIAAQHEVYRRSLARRDFVAIFDRLSHTINKGMLDRSVRTSCRQWIHTIETCLEPQLRGKTRRSVLQPQNCKARITALTHNAASTVQQPLVPPRPLQPSPALAIPIPQHVGGPVGTKKNISLKIILPSLLILWLLFSMLLRTSQFQSATAPVSAGQSTESIAPAAQPSKTAVTPSPQNSTTRPVAPRFDDTPQSQEGLTVTALPREAVRPAFLSKVVSQDGNVIVVTMGTNVAEQVSILDQRSGVEERFALDTPVRVTGVLVSPKARFVVITYGGASLGSSFGLFQRQANGAYRFVPGSYIEEAGSALAKTKTVPSDDIAHVYINADNVSEDPDSVHVGISGDYIESRSHQQVHFGPILGRWEVGIGWIIQGETASTTTLQPQPLSSTPAKVKLPTEQFDPSRPKDTEESVKSSPLVSTQQVAVFIDQHLQNQKSRDTSRIIGDYTERVSYCNNGLVGRLFIQREKEAYFARWPITEENPTGEIIINEINQGKEWTAEFSSHFRVVNEARHEWIQGETERRYKIVCLDNNLKIAEEEEKITKRERGSLESKFATQQFRTRVNMASPMFPDGKWVDRASVEESDETRTSTNTIQVIGSSMTYDMQCIVRLKPGAQKQNNPSLNGSLSYSFTLQYRGAVIQRTADTLRIKVLSAEVIRKSPPDVIVTLRDSPKNKIGNEWVFLFRDGKCVDGNNPNVVYSPQ